MKTRFITVLLLLIMVPLWSSGRSEGRSEKISGGITLEQGEKPKYIFYFIGDGLGTSQRQIAEYYLQHRMGDEEAELAMNSLPVAGLTTTHSASTLITDSAAAGTALATGRKTNNRMISLSPDGKERFKTILEAAEENGFATGLVTTVTISHATPAAFAAHVNDRDRQAEIASQYLDQDIEYFAGGGLEYFLPYTDERSKREDERNLVREFTDKGYTFLDSREALMSADLASKKRVLGLYSDGHLPYYIDRINQNIDVPTLAEMLDGGIDVLSQNKEGFFLMCEAGQIDRACHLNDLPAAIHDIYAFDKAVEKALDFYKKHPDETLILVAADHETGGMGLGFGNEYDLNLAPIDKAKGSVGGALAASYMRNPRDLPGFVKAIEENYGIVLSDEERDLFIREFGAFLASAGRDRKKLIYGFGSHIGRFLSERTRVEWTSSVHTAAPIPITAIGVGADQFSGFKDNREIPLTLAKIAGWEL